MSASVVLSAPFPLAVPVLDLDELGGGPNSVGPKTMDKFEACIWLMCDRSDTLHDRRETR